MKTDIFFLDYQWSGGILENSNDVILNNYYWIIIILVTSDTLELSRLVSHFSTSMFSCIFRLEESPGLKVFSFPAPAPAAAVASFSLLSVVWRSLGLCLLKQSSHQLKYKLSLTWHHCLHCTCLTCPGHGSESSHSPLTCRYHAPTRRLTSQRLVLICWPIKVFTWQGGVTGDLGQSVGLLGWCGLVTTLHWPRPHTRLTNQRLVLLCVNQSDVSIYLTNLWDILVNLNHL